MRSIKLNIVLPCLLTIVTFASESIADVNNWSTNGPNGASVYCIEIHPQNPQIIYIGTIQNGIYKSTDGGNIWNHIDTENQFRCMRRIAIHPNDPDTIYATATNGIFKSSDKGENWIRLFPPHGIYNEYRAILIHPQDPNLLIAGGSSNEWISTNSGQSWNQLNIPHPVGIEDIAVDPSNPDVIYLVTNATDYGYGVFKTTDRGTTWFCIQNNIIGNMGGGSIAIDRQNSQVIYLSLNNFFGSDSCLFKSTDGGQNWVEISPQNLSMSAIFKVGVSPFENNAVYACTANDGVFKSTDGGLSWQDSNDSLRILLTSTIEFDSLGNIIYLGTYQDGIYKSTNSGTYWQRISYNIIALGCQAIATSHIDPNKCYVATVNGLHSTINGGLSWEYVDLDLSNYHGVGNVALDEFNSANIYICTHHQIWSNPVLETGFYRSLNEGDTWEFFNNGLPGDNSYRDIAISYFGSEDKRIFLSSFRGIYYSDNLGEDWSICSNGLPQNSYFLVIEVSSSAQNVIAAGSIDNLFYLSADRGESWQQIYDYPDTSGWHIIDIEFHPYQSEHIYVSSEGGALFETTNTGQTWVNIINNLPVYPDAPVVSGIAINPYNPSNIFVSSSRYGIYQSHNGGQNWEAFNNGLDTTATAGFIEFAAGDTNHIYFASRSRSVWTITRTPTGIDDSFPDIPGQINLAAYPNPFNNSTTIEFALPEAGEVSLTIYDILGREVKRPVTGFKEAGRYAITVDMDEASSGVYFYILTTDKKTISRSMILIK